jgi:hypothetical protein
MGLRGLGATPQEAIAHLPGMTPYYANREQGSKRGSSSDREQKRPRTRWSLHIRTSADCQNNAYTDWKGLGRASETCIMAWSRKDCVHNRFERVVIIMGPPNGTLLFDTNWSEASGHLQPLQERRGRRIWYDGLRLLSREQWGLSDPGRAPLIPLG